MSRSVTEPASMPGLAVQETVVDMDMTSRTRPPWVWAALSLQLVLSSLSVYACIQAFLFLSRHTASRMVPPPLFRDFIAATTTVSLIGLWRTKRWGWGLALIAAGTMCVQFLWFLLDYPTVVIRFPSFLAFNIWQFAALAVLLYRPVREHFVEQRARSYTLPLVPTENLQHQTGKPLHWVVYFCVAVVSTCVLTAFSLALFMGQKHPGNGGSRGFALYLVLGLVNGSVASFLFALFLTLLARKLGPTRPWPWLLLGGTLAPVLILIFAFIGNYLGQPFYSVFWGPVVLLQIWWLTPPTGVITGWICYLMYPWCLFTPRPRL
jgi:hypothetical protein